MVRNSGNELKYSKLIHFTAILIIFGFKALREETQSSGSAILDVLTFVSQQIANVSIHKFVGPYFVKWWFNDFWWWLNDGQTDVRTILVVKLLSILNETSNLKTKVCWKNHNNVQPE